jgi:hypothetical protein
VQDCRHDIIRTVGFAKPVEIILAPLAEFSGSLYPLHIFRRTGEHDTDCPDLVRSNLAGQPGGIEAMLDSLWALLIDNGKNPCFPFVIRFSGNGR